MLATGAVALRVYQWNSGGHAYRAISDAKSYARGGNLIGAPTAAVQAIIFSDFQCPYCRMAEASLERVQRDKPQLLSIRYRHYPLSSHPNSRIAAIAASCAGRVGKFQFMHDTIFSHADALQHADWTLWAARVGIADTMRYKKCMADSEPLPAIEADLADGRRLRMNGTPALIIGDRVFLGNPDTADLRKAIESAMRDR
jgi:protein-disulfide isomerase